MFMSNGNNNANNESSREGKEGMEINNKKEIWDGHKIEYGENPFHCAHDIVACVYVCVRERLLAAAEDGACL